MVHFLFSSIDSRKLSFRLLPLMILLSENLQKLKEMFMQLMLFWLQLCVAQDPTILGILLLRKLVSNAFDTLKNF